MRNLPPGQPLLADRVQVGLGPDGRGIVAPACGASSPSGAARRMPRRAIGGRFGTGWIGLHPALEGAAGWFAGCGECGISLALGFRSHKAVSLLRVCRTMMIFASRKHGGGSGEFLKHRGLVAVR